MKQYKTVTKDVDAKLVANLTAPFTKIYHTKENTLYLRAKIMLEWLSERGITAPMAGAYAKAICDNITQDLAQCCQQWDTPLVDGVCAICGYKFPNLE